MDPLAWGAKIDPDARQKVFGIALRLGVHPDFLMSCIAFESGETFNPAIRNAAGSGAVGLIQFMPQTAAMMETTPEELAEMTVLQQLDYVERYFAPYRGRVQTLADLYMVILWPRGIGQPDYYVLFDKADPYHPLRYIENRGLDFNGDGKILKSEAVLPVARKLEKGRLPEFAA